MLPLPFSDALYFRGISPTLTIDGHLIVSDANEAKFYLPPTPYDPIVAYAQPTSYGSIGVVGIQSVGVVVRPMEEGVHVIHLYESYIIPGLFGVIFDNTWTITVTDDDN